MAENWSLGVIMIFFLSLKLQDKVRGQSIPPPAKIFVREFTTARIPYTYGYVGTVYEIKYSYTSPAGQHVYFYSVDERGKPQLDQVARNQFEGRVKYIGDKGGGVLKDATLTIERFTKQDAGKFEIEIIGEIPIQMKAITTLQAKVLANVTQFKTNKNDIKEGDDITLSCTVSKGLPSPRIEILKNNRKIKELLGSNTSDTILNYNFTRISHNSGGSYICEVRTNGYVSRKSYDFEVKFKPTIKTFKSEPTIAILGKSLKITCEAEGVPEPNYIILHNCSILAGVTNGVKTIKAIQYSAAGSYTCTANNILGNCTESFNLTVEVQPTATLNVSSPSTVPENSDVYYRCEGKNGVPTSNVSWYKGNTFVVKGKILSFRNINREQAGSYTCKVQSGTWTDETELEIIVQFKPSSTTLKSVPDIPIITKSVKITCKAEGLPEPTYVIYHNATKLADKGEITINPVKYSHAGEYRCNATNKLGMYSGSYFLKVKVLLEKSKSDCTGCAWYIILVTLVCGIIVGIVFIFGIMSLRRRFKSKKDETRRRINNETKIEDEANYQELDKVREKENSYQSLNPV